MKLSAILTLHDRSFSDLQKVFDSLKNQAHDELVIVFDQTPVVLADYCHDYWKADPRTVFTEAPDRAPGWRSPVKAWNAGFRKASGDVLYCFSSETVQAEGNVERARTMMDEDPEITRKVEEASTAAIRYRFPEYPWPSTVFTENIVLHGKVECSCGPDGKEVTWSDNSPGNLFGDAAHPRPLGFIWAAPAAAVKQIGGYDEAFDSGYWFDDDDFFFRLWDTGLDFVFDDSISGIHLHHERPVLATEEGQAGIRKNAEYMLWKHGFQSTNWGRLIGSVERREGRTAWRH